MSYVDLSDIIKDQVPVDERRSGYLVDLTTLSLAEGQDGKATSWVHALSLGEYKHPFWGKLKFTPERIQRFASNVMNKVRGVDLAIDYSHNADGVAAGWVQTAEARPDGLWVLVEWTQKAADAIRNKEYRYFSSDFADEWEDSTGKSHKDVLFGGGLTNRPFLKDLVPVNLSEYFGEGKEKEEDEPMKELLKALGLAEDATEEQALEALTKLQEPPTPKPEDKPKDPPAPVDDELTKLAEDNPVVKKLMDQVLELQTENRLTQAKALVDGWGIHSTTKFALPEAVTTKLTVAISSAPKALQESITEVMDHILKNGLVKLSESGRKRTDDPEPPAGGTAAKRFDEKVKELMKEDDTITFAEAVSQVSFDDEELYEEYRREALAGVTEDINEEDD